MSTYAGVCLRVCHQLPSRETLILYLCIDTRDVFYVRRVVDLMKTAIVNAYIMHLFGKTELSSIHAT